MDVKKVNQSALDQLEKAKFGDPDKVPEGKATVPLCVPLETLKAVQEMYDILVKDPNKETKSDTVKLCIEITYTLFSEVLNGAEVYIKNIVLDDNGEERLELTQLSFPGLDPEKMPHVNKGKIEITPNIKL